MSTYTQLDPTFKAKWLKALRSKKYRQAKGALRRTFRDNAYDRGANGETEGEGYCCVGVGCNVLDAKGWEQEPTHPTHPLLVRRFGWKGHSSGSTKALPFINGRTFTRLAKMNDEDHKTFPEIADWIEKYL